MFQMWIAVHPNHDKSRREPTITRQSRFIMQRLACNTCASWVRSSTNRERESWRRHPYQMLSFEKDDTHTPSSSFCVVVLSGDHRPPLTAVPPFKEPIGTPVAHRRQYFHQIIVESSSSIFCPKTDNTLQLSGGAATQARVSICKRQLISTYVCVFNNSSNLHMKPDTNNSARKLYILRTISNPRRCHRTQHICPPEKEIGFSVNKNLLFPCYTVFVFPSFLVLRVLFVSRIPILVTFEQKGKTLPKVSHLPKLAVAGISKGEGKTNSCRFSGELLRFVRR